VLNLFADGTYFGMRQAGFMRLLVGFHFFLLMFPLGFVGELGLDFIAKEKGSPEGVGAVLAVF
jgi:hypothetical protein